MPAVTNGAELVRKLREHGTGEGKLVAARTMLADIHKNYNRIASSDEVIDEMERAGVHETTLLKARTLAETGEWHGPPDGAMVPIEDLLLGGPAVAVALDSDAEKPEKRKPGRPAKTVAPRPTDPNRPGVYSTNTEAANTVGPVPAAT